MTKTFTDRGDFAALYAAQRWLQENGVSYGSLCRGDPVGLMRGDVVIAKWRNLSDQDRSELDGRMTGDFRNGPVTVELKEDK